MRYAIVSDIHGNLPAWNTVFSDIALRGVDRILCLGDVIGYGPEPAEVLKSVYARVHLMVLGNHDAVVAGRMSASVFNDRAQRMIEWTAEQLGSQACDFFKSLPLVLKGTNFRCVHGDFTDPAVYHYIKTPEAAKASFSAVPEQILFCGHSHQANLFVLGASGIPHAMEPQDFTLEPGKRYIVNVGSVGYSRSSDPRATYVIFDEDTGSVRFFRLSYDFEAFRAAAARRGLGEDEIPLLRRAPSGSLESVRDELDFSPNVAQRVEGAVVENDVSMLLRRRTALWKTIAIVAVVAGLTATALATALAGKAGTHAATFPPNRALPIAKNAYVWPDGNILPPLAIRMVGGFSAEPFRLVLGDGRTQSAKAVMLGSGRSCVQVKSANDHVPIIFESPDILCRARERFETLAKVAFDEDFTGTVTLKVNLLRDIDGKTTESVLLTCNFNNRTGLRDENLPTALHDLPNTDGWCLARGTAAIPPGATAIRVELSGTFTGGIRIGGIAVRRK